MMGQIKKNNPVILTKKINLFVPHSAIEIAGMYKKQRLSFAIFCVVHF